MVYPKFKIEEMAFAGIDIFVGQTDGFKGNIGGDLRVKTKLFFTPDRLAGIFNTNLASIFIAG